MKIKLGEGVLNWPRDERHTDRYGVVKLFKSSDPQSLEEFQFVPTSIDEKGRLIALVKEARLSYHVGDMDRKIKPTMPSVGERIILGEGMLFFEGNSVGLKPDDGREIDWLDIKALYRAHHQTVELFFEKD